MEVGVGGADAFVCQLSESLSAALRFCVSICLCVCVSGSLPRCVCLALPWRGGDWSRMTHLEPSGAPAAGRPPPQLEGEEDEEEGEEEEDYQEGEEEEKEGAGASPSLSGPSSEAAAAAAREAGAARGPGTGAGAGPGAVGPAPPLSSSSCFSLCSRCGRGPSRRGSPRCVPAEPAAPRPMYWKHENAAPALPEGCRLPAEGGPATDQVSKRASGRAARATVGQGPGPRRAGPGGGRPRGGGVRGCACECVYVSV